MRRLIFLGAAAVLVLAGCGSGGEVPDIDAGTATTAGSAGDHGHGANVTCSPSGTTVTVVASGTKFNSECFAAPANQPFTLSYENKDTLTHNIVILESHTATEVMFRADGFQGPKTMTFNVPALKAGTFAFHCEFHPSRMLGTFVVK